MQLPFLLKGFALLLCLTCTDHLVCSTAAATTDLSADISADKTSVTNLRGRRSDNGANEDLLEARLECAKQPKLIHTCVGLLLCQPTLLNKVLHSHHSRMQLSHLFHVRSKPNLIKPLHHQLEILYQPQHCAP